MVEAVEATHVPIAVDYTTMNKAALLEALGGAWNNGKDPNLKLMGKLSTLVAKAEAVEAKAAKDELFKALNEVTGEVSGKISQLVVNLFEKDERLKGAQGVWFSYDTEQPIEKGINPACRLVKSSRKATDGGGGSSTGSYVSNETPSKVMLEEIGDEVLFTEATTRTIDKVEHVMPAGMTYAEAYAFSANGGWRNFCRMALLKKTGRVGG